MKLSIDTEKKELIIDGKPLDLYSKEAFESISDVWLKVGWNEKYIYTFSWLGRPIIQLPEDMIRMQEVIYRLKPDVIIETGIAHGGSLIYYASICKAIGKGRIIGIDIDIRKHNRKAIEEHELFPYLTLIEGSSIDPDIVAKVKSFVNPDEKVIVILDSCHLKNHVFSELEAYCDLIPEDFYIVATDGSMQDLYETPRGTPGWIRDNPVEAVRDFLEKHDDFVFEQPSWPFNESNLDKVITHWPNAWLKKINVKHMNNPE